MSKSNGRIRPTIVDLFCGCGGFSLGAELAGFRSIVAIDIDHDLQSSFRRNFRQTAVIEANVADIDGQDWPQLIGRDRPDGLVGGPPCQGFSWIGKRQTNDPRNNLVHQFYRHVGLLRPKFFVMENVEGILHSSSVDVLNLAIESIAKHYQIIGTIVVNAADFGAPTVRKRVVVIGYDPQEVDALSERSFTKHPPKEMTTVRDAISDLPSPIPEDDDELSFGWAKYPGDRGRKISDYAASLRKGPSDGMGWKESVERHSHGYVSGLTSTRHRPDIARRYAVLAPGKSDPITKSYRLDWDGQSPTLRAGTGADKGAFQAVRPLHPGMGRVITVREGARLQGFPDWFVFHPTKWHSFRMLGNSVSPIVSRAILSILGSKIGVPLAV